MPCTARFLRWTSATFYYPSISVRHGVLPKIATKKPSPILCVSEFRIRPSHWKRKSFLFTIKFRDIPVVFIFSGVRGVRSSHSHYPTFRPPFPNVYRRYIYYLLFDIIINVIIYITVYNIVRL